MYYREDKARPDPAGRHQRGRRHVLVDRRGDLVLRPNNRIMVPFYIYYSMFGFQRVGDLPGPPATCRRAASCSAAPPGRTTLNGEGLQHEDGHSHILAGTIPNCVALRPDLRARGRRDHARRPAAHGREAGERLLLPHADERELRAPGLPPGSEEDIIKGMYLLQEGEAQEGKPRVQLLGCGTILREVIAAPNCSRRTGASPPTSGAARASTSWRATARTPSAGTCCIRPRSRACRSCAQLLEKHGRPGRRVDRLHARRYAEQIRAFMPKGRTYKVLGTDGFGRSDFARQAARASSRSTATTSPSRR